MKNFKQDLCLAMTYNQSDTADFVTKARLVHGHIYDYSKTEYSRSCDKVKIICPKHGEFEQTPNSHLSGAGCKKCYHLKAGSYRKLSVPSFIEKAKFVHGDNYDYSKVNYINSQTKVIIGCPLHGDFEQIPNDHLQGKGCYQCRNYELSLKFRSNVEEFIEKAMIIHNGKYGYYYVNYINSHLKVDILCFKHGMFKQSPSKHLSGQGCPVCKSSKGELVIYKILKENNINFIQEFRLDKNYKFLYDFYLPDHNLLIEFHGKQHFEPVEFFGGQQSLVEVMLRDSWKKDLAKAYKIPLLEFHYRQLDSLTEDEFKQFVLTKVNERKPK